MKRWIYLLMFLIVLQTVSSATIQGNVYDISLDKVKNSIIEINTVPNQKLVAKEGSYTFSSIPKGTYTITAYTSDEHLKTNESIVIEQDGTYTIDLFLIPELEGSPKKTNWWYYLIIILVILGLFILFIKSRKTKKEKEPKEEIDNDLDKVLEIIKKEGNRTTQKHIKEITGLSEAKVSLMITDLESKGLVKRIKKGRANILILTEANK